MYPFSMAMAHGLPLSRDIFTAEALSSVSSVALVRRGGRRRTIHSFPHAYHARQLRDYVNMDYIVDLCKFLILIAERNGRQPKVRVKEKIITLPNKVYLLDCHSFLFFFLSF